MYIGDGISDFDNYELNLEIKKWINAKIRYIVQSFYDEMYEIEWDTEELRYFFPRRFVTDNGAAKCREVLDEIFDILDNPWSNVEFLPPLYEYVLVNIISYFIENCELTRGKEGFIQSFPLSDEILGMLKSEYSKREEEIKKYYDDSSEYEDDPEDDEDTAESFAEYLTGEDIFWDVLFDSTCSDYDYINADVAECLKSMKENKASYDLRQYEPLMNRTNYDIYKAIMREKGSDFSDHEDYLIREIENSLNMVSEQVAEFDDFSERQLSAFILAILKRKVMSERKIVAEREAQIGFSNKRVGSADILFYMNEEVYVNLGVLELKFYNDFREIKQVLGYLNASFQFGGTVTIVKGNIEKAIEKCIEYLKSNGDELHVLRIDRLSGFALKSRILLPDSDGKEINLYHFFLDVGQDFHRKMAEEARR